MKSSLLAGVSLIAFAAGAQAADLPRAVYKAPALVPAVWNWTGFYVGANVGLVRAKSSASDDGPNPPYWISGAGGTPGSISADSTGVIGGLQGGYNWQTGNLVVGIEGDISFSSANRTVTVTSAPGGNDSYKSQLSTLGTVRGRIGWALDRALIYGTGGVAFASFKNEYSDPATVIGFDVGPNSTVTGWTAGGGIEYALVDHWTVKAEYLHVGFPTRTASVTPIPGNTYAFAFKDSLDIGRVGINYKF